MRPRVVICGSYHRDLIGLKRIFRELEATGCRILSPLSVDFEDTSREVVRLSSETTFSIRELEKFHLRAIEEADFVWLHAPKGYIGLSASYELGFSIAKNKPVFCFQDVNDEMLATQISRTTSVYAALETISLL